MGGLQSIMMGMSKGAQAGPALAGTLPSAQNVGGAPPNQSDIDKATAPFDDSHQSLMALSSLLRTLRDDESANQIADLAVKLKNIQLGRRKKLADQQVNNTGAASPVAPVANLSAMGVPKGY